ncbi:carbamoyl-phosphate synthase large subunit [Treponema parvum]|uniref:carbamoyl-phosphate synthase large subunit n=1 Tax=Treponema parvum TaxID=138851 RepID=UPI001AEC67FE|nr:carbamoyl-phosphate synthase large subunit [Treponema parvum]QTQ17297.1 carbamoyl-phosphate synthase large subunit [Treponema parvum]
MPLNTSIKKIMVIGSGPIVIGQAAEFDYAGTQACKVLKEQGINVVLVNSNPATLMTDHSMADSIYIEPLIPETVKRIIEKEKPDSLLSTLGGQTGLTLSMELAKSGFLKEHNVRLLGANPETIDKAEDRQMFKDTMLSIGEPCIPSKVVTTLEGALDFADNEIGYPVIVRPAFTLGGTGGGIANDRKELEEIAHNGLHRSPIHQILVEKCISGWKEIEFEVIRDHSGNVITVCSMENFDPVGIHTGDSIVVAPAVTLADKEYQMLRSSALNIISALKIEGGCNCQFALKPDSFEYAVIEVNPRVSRSSALASKATGYPIAKVATLIAIGYNLDEIPNAVTQKTAACFEPVVDYIVVKFPKWPFDKFVYAKRTLGTQMKATGEVMSIGRSFEEALMKAVRGAEIGVYSLRLKAFSQETDEQIKKRVGEITDLRIFAVYEALRRKILSVRQISEITKIDAWFISKLENIAALEDELESVKNKNSTLSNELYLKAKKSGFPDKVIESLSKVKIPGGSGILQDSKAAEKLRKEGKLAHIPATYKMVDTCAGEFNAETPYFYAGYDEQNEAAEFLKNRKNTESKKGTIIVLGSGPIRIGQGIEFDYASVQCVWSLKKLGYEVAIINNNPETVSTDFDTADRLYFEPLTPEDVMNVIHTEKPFGVVVAFGGQTAIKLTKFLDKQGIKILGTSADSIDIAEDRERFEQLCEKLKINRPKGETVFTTEQALLSAERIGYPVLLRPSYVLGGQNMIIAFTPADIKEYMSIILAQEIENPVLIDKYMMGTELEVDAICDGKDILIPGIMEHIERTGIHSGDSIAVYPSWNLNDILREKIINQSRELALALKTRGLINIQYLVYNNSLYIIEVNPRSSRTVPYISKVTGVPMVELATQAMLGKSIKEMGYGKGLYKIPPYFAVKVPVFSFEKLMDVDTHLGPEMKSTGEVLGLASTMEEAIFKGLIAAGYKMKRGGGVLFTVRKTDQYEIPDLARKFYDMGFTLYATEGTAKVIRDFGMEVITVNKIHENSENNFLTLLDSEKIDYVVSTSAKGRNPAADSVKMRRHAIERDIPCLTSIDTANAIANCLMSHYSAENVELVNINDLRSSKQKIRFSKMHSTGNDFIVINAMAQVINNPAGLSVRLCNRRTGIGADSLVLIERSDKADAYMKFFNQDGSEGRLAGNAIRSVAKYLFDNNINGIAARHALVTDPTATITIETASGIKSLVLYKQNGKISSVTVDMGKPEFSPDSLPTTLKDAPFSPPSNETQNNPLLPKRAVVNESLFVGDEKYKVSCVSVGVPHCVVFCDFVDKVDIFKVGPLFENNKAFPQRVNTEFVRVAGPNELKMRTWERGNGETPACGTGACAAVVAAVLNGYCKLNENITVKVRGGELIVKYTGKTVFLTGATELVYEGNVEI